LSLIYIKNKKEKEKEIVTQFKTFLPHIYEGCVS
jgi:hypothetical protein